MEKIPTAHEDLIVRRAHWNSRAGPLRSHFNQSSHSSGPPCPRRLASQHDGQLDYYGKRLATCSSDRTVKIYDVMEGGERKQVADLKGCVACFL